MGVDFGTSNVHDNGKGGKKKLRTTKSHQQVGKVFYEEHVGKTQVDNLIQGSIKSNVQYRDPGRQFTPQMRSHIFRNTCDH